MSLPVGLAGKGARELEHDGDARAIVADARTAGNAVVMRADEHRFAAAGSAVQSDDVLDRGAAGIAPAGSHWSAACTSGA